MCIIHESQTELKYSADFTVQLSQPTYLKLSYIYRDQKLSLTTVLLVSDNNSEVKNQINTINPKAHSKNHFQRIGPTIISLLFVQQIWSQESEFVDGFKIAMEKAMQADNVYSSFVTGPDDASRSTFTRANDGSYVIPVVVHVLHEDGAENISDEQITDAIEHANMQMAGGEGGFDVEIELRLARIDPDGNCTNGITRHLVDNSIVNLNQYDDLGNPDPDNYDPNALSDEEMKDIVRWPVDNYLNIWIVRCIEGNPDPGCGTNGGVAGYSYFPTVSDYLDGIVIKHKYFGNSGTAALIL